MENNIDERGATFLAYRNFVAHCDRLSRWFVVAAMGFMAAIVSVQVLMRYGFNYSIDSADELARLFFVWAMFLGIPHGIRHGIHVGIDVITMLLPKRIQVQLYRIMAVFSTLLMMIVTYATVQVTADKWQELMPTINVTSAVFYIAVLVAAAHSILHLLVLTWGGPDSWKDLDHPDEDNNSGDLEEVAP